MINIALLISTRLETISDLAQPTLGQNVNFILIMIVMIYCRTKRSKIVEIELTYHLYMSAVITHLVCG